MVARQLAEQTLGTDATATRQYVRDEAAVEAALRLAELWLDAVTALPGRRTAAVAWSRAPMAPRRPNRLWAELGRPDRGEGRRTMGSAIPAETTAIEKAR